VHLQWYHNFRDFEHWGFNFGYFNFRCSNYVPLGWPRNQGARFWCVLPMRTPRTRRDSAVWALRITSVWRVYSVNSAPHTLAASCDLWASSRFLPTHPLPPQRVAYVRAAFYVCGVTLVIRSAHAALSWRTRGIRVGSTFHKCACSMRGRSNKALWPTGCARALSMI
jgi:hypothetical protein